MLRFWVLGFLLLSPLLGKAETLKVAIINSRPFFWAENGKNRGFHYELAVELSKRMGNTLEFQAAPVDRAIKILSHGDAEMLILSDSKALEDLHAVKEHLLTIDTLVFNLASDKPITTKNEVKGTIARMGSGGCIDLSEQPGLQWIDTQSYEQAYRLLVAKRVHSVCGSIAFRIVADRLAANPNEIKSTVIGSKKMWVYMMPSLSKKRRTEIQNAIKALKAEGEIERLADKRSN